MQARKVTGTLEKRAQVVLKVLVDLWRSSLSDGQSLVTSLEKIQYGGFTQYW